MEYWELKVGKGLFYILYRTILIKIDLIPTKPSTPTLHYSTIPLRRITAHPIFSDPSHMKWFSVLQ